MISLSRLLGAASRSDYWLKSPASPHLWTLELTGFGDSLDADAIWDDITGDQPAVVELDSGDAHRRLRQALHDHRRRVKQRLANGKLVEQGQVFTDVVLEVPEVAWNDALRVGAGSLEVLVHNLEQRHREDFKDVLPASRTPHYVVVPDAGLAADRVRCHFGYGVHVPGADETPELEFTVARGDSAEVGEPGGAMGFPPWVWFRDERREERAVGLYPQQNAQVLCPGWPLSPRPWFSDGAGYVLLRRESMGGWSGFGDDRHTRFVTRQPATRGHGPRLRFESLDNIDEAPLTVELHSVVEPAQQAGIGTLTPAAAPLPGLSPYALWLDGMVLPGLLAGLSGWTLWLDAEGYPLAADRLPAGADAVALSYDGERLRARLPGIADALVLTEFPQYLRVGRSAAGEASGIELDSPLQADGLPLLRLPQPLRMALDQQELLLGRFDPTPGAEQADLLLDLLDQPGSLHWGGRDRQGVIGAIGLSRRHLRLRLDGEQLLLFPEGNSVVTLLDARGGVMGVSGADGAVLTVGQQMLVGCYLLRFDHDA